MASKESDTIRTPIALEKLVEIIRAERAELQAKVDVPVKTAVTPKLNDRPADEVRGR